jgi:predicted RNA-binding Zn-ribbon protein involved in translation (DUF1610 family)
MSAEEIRICRTCGTALAPQDEFCPVCGGCHIDAGSSCRNTEFASPEQFTGADVDIRYDLYSLGITLRQMLTGHRRFEELRSVRMGSADCMSGQPGLSALLAWLKTTV